MSSSRNGTSAQSMPTNVFTAFGHGAELLRPLMRSASRVQLEMAGFAVARTRAWLELSADLARCRTPQQVVEVQLGFARHAGQDWLEAGRRIGAAWQPVLTGRAPETEPARVRDIIDLSSADQLRAPSASGVNGHAPRRVTERRQAA